LKDVRFAAHAMTALQGYVLFSSERGGMRIEYAKNKMGELSSQSIPVSNLSDNSAIICQGKN